MTDYLNLIRSSHGQLTILTLSHPSPELERTWTWSIVFMTSHLIVLSHNLLPSPDGTTWTWSIILEPLIWSSSSYVSRVYVKLVVCLNTPHFILIRLQDMDVRQLDQYWIFVIWLSRPHPFVHLQYVRYLSQFDCLNTPHLKYPSSSHPLHTSPGRTLTWSNRSFEYPHLIILSSSVYRT